MAINFLSNLAIILILEIVQVSFLTTWPFPINSLNLILSAIIFVTVIFNYQRGLWWAFGGGVIWELYSGMPFGISSLTFIIVAVIINFLFNNFFTNRSLYSLLILGYLGTVVYSLIVFLVSFVFLTLNLGNYFAELRFWPNFFWQPLLNLLILTIIFFAFHNSTSRLRNIFLSADNLYEIKK